MTAPNISLMGATYPTVSGVTLPKDGGGTATFPWVEGSETKTENGTYDVTRLAEVVVNVSGGGGGNIVTGTFTPTSTEKGTAKSITIPYSGSGYPIYGVIYPSGGAWQPSGTLTTLVQRYAIIWAAFVKDDFSATPDYVNKAAQNYGETYLQYKSSDNDATVVAYSAKHNLRLYYTSAALAYTDNFWRINRSTSMSVYIANTSYGFASGIEYTYRIVYSS